MAHRLTLLQVQRKIFEITKLQIFDAVVSQIRPLATMLRKCYRIVLNGSYLHRTKNFAILEKYLV